MNIEQEHIDKLSENQKSILIKFLISAVSNSDSGKIYNAWMDGYNLLDYVDVDKQDKKFIYDFIADVKIINAWENNNGNS